MAGVNRKLIVNDGRVERELLLVGTLVVGRDPFCDVSDSGELLSRRHAEFVASATDVQVRDLGSRNGILVNGVKVGHGALRPGDVVQVGHLQVRYVEDQAAAVVETVPGADETALMNRRRPSGPVPAPAAQNPAPSAPTPAPALALPASDSTVVMASRKAVRPATSPASPQPAAALQPMQPPAGLATTSRPPAAAPAGAPTVRVPVAALAATVFLGTAIPLLLSRSEVLSVAAALALAFGVALVAASATTVFIARRCSPPSRTRLP